MYIIIKRYVLKYGIFKCFYIYGNKLYFIYLINGCVSLYVLSILMYKKKDDIDGFSIYMNEEMLILEINCE